MHTSVSVPLWIPDWIAPRLRGWLRSTTTPRHFDGLSGDRDIEWSWVADRMPEGTGPALDFGCGKSSLSLLAARRGFEVEAVDLETTAFPYRHPRLEVLQGDLLDLDLVTKSYDLVINCSSIEHVGLAGRYGVHEADPNGDLKVMQRLRSLLSWRGVMLLTIPVGRDAVWSPWCRVYGERRLPQLLRGFDIDSEEYWHKPPDHGWATTDRATALSTASSVTSSRPHRNSYDLGCFVLRTSH